MNVAIAKVNDSAIVNRHFHLDGAGTISGAAYKLKIQLNMMRMLSALKRTSLFAIDPIDDPTNTDFAYAFVGGYDSVGESEPKGAKRRLDLIYVRKPFGTLWLKSRTACIVHELAHYVGGKTDSDSIDHFAQEFPSPKGTPYPGCKQDYENLTPEEATRNAASYATYVIHAFYGFDNRAGSF